MSSTLSRPDAPAATIAPTIEHTPADAEDHPPSDEREFRGFATAIGLGIAIGLPVVMAIIALTVKVVDPSLDTAGLLAIVIWVGIWTGVFLGGTVTVGLWSSRQH